MNLIFANNYYYIRGGSERVFFEEMEVHLIRIIIKIRG
jgi:hypothetical protein